MKEEVLYTTKEQSDALVKAGLKPSTADMHYKDYFNDGGWCASLCYDEEDAKNGGDGYAPCWSGANLFALLPKKVYDDEFFYPIAMEVPDDSKAVVIEYEFLVSFDGESLTEALCNAMLWVLENTEAKEDGIYVKDTIYDKK